MAKRVYWWITDAGYEALTWARLTDERTDLIDYHAYDMAIYETLRSQLYD